MKNSRPQPFSHLLVKVFVFSLLLMVITAQETEREPPVEEQFSRDHANFEHLYGKHTEEIGLPKAPKVRVDYYSLVVNLLPVAALLVNPHPALLLFASSISMIRDGFTVDSMMMALCAFVSVFGIKTASTHKLAFIISQTCFAIIASVEITQLYFIVPFALGLVVSMYPIMLDQTPQTILPCVVSFLRALPILGERVFSQIMFLQLSGQIKLAIYIFITPTRQFLMQTSHLTLLESFMQKFQYSLYNTTEEFAEYYNLAYVLLIVKNLTAVWMIYQIIHMRRNYFRTVYSIALIRFGLIFCVSSIYTSNFEMFVLLGLTLIFYDPRFVSTGKFLTEGLEIERDIQWKEAIMTLKACSYPVVEAIKDAMVEIIATNENGSTSTSKGIILEDNEVLTIDHAIPPGTVKLVIDGKDVSDKYTLTVTKKGTAEPVKKITTSSAVFSNRPKAKIRVAHKKKSEASILSSDNMISTFSYELIGNQIVTEESHTVPGTSGSPIFDREGYVIGIHSGTNGSSNFGTALH